MSENLTSRGVRVLKEEGIVEFIRKFRRFCKREAANRYPNSKIRQFVPKAGEFQTYNDIVVEEKRLGDDFLNSLPDNPSYEAEFVEYIREHVGEGDSVVVIGGYFGVSTIAAANRVGEEGSVITFEATPEGAARVRKTARLNDVQRRVTVYAASVGPIYQTKGRVKGDDKIPPDELPDCDVLAIDCDGCELDVLDNIEIRPQTIIVEHHGTLSSSKHDADGLDFEYQQEKLEDILSSMEYKITDEYSYSRSKNGFDDQIGWFVAERFA